MPVHHDGGAKAMLLLSIGFLLLLAWLVNLPAKESHSSHEAGFGRLKRSRVEVFPNSSTALDSAFIEGLKHLKIKHGIPFGTKRDLQLSPAPFFEQGIKNNSKGPYHGPQKRTFEAEW